MCLYESESKEESESELESEGSNESKRLEKSNDNLENKLLSTQEGTLIGYNNNNNNNDGYGSDFLQSITSKEMTCTDSFHHSCKYVVYSKSFMYSYYRFV